MIRERLLWGFVLIALVPLLGVGVATLLVSYYNDRQQSVDRLESVAARKELAIRTWAQSWQQELQVVSQTDYSPKHPTIALKMIRELDHPASQERSASPLTDREIQVLKLVAQGLTNQEIADRLVISEWTVRTHVRNILGKLHLANRTQATLYALREGLAKSERRVTQTALAGCSAQRI